MGRIAKETSDSYHVRVNRVDGVDDANLLEWCRDLGCSFAACFEAADDEVANDHYHVVLDGVTDSRAKGSLLKRFPGLKNPQRGLKFHSCEKVRDRDAMDLYIWKGGKEEPYSPPVIVGWYGVRYTPEYLKDLPNKWWRNRAAAVAAKRSGCKTLKDEMDAKVAGLKVKSIDAIAAAVVDLYVERGKALNTHYLKTVITGYMAKYSEKYKAAYMANLIESVRMDGVTCASGATDINIVEELCI